LEYIDPDVVDTTLGLKVDNCLPVYTASYSRTLITQSTPL